MGKVRETRRIVDFEMRTIELKFGEFRGQYQWKGNFRLEKPGIFSRIEKAIFPSLVHFPVCLFVCLFVNY